MNSCIIIGSGLGGLSCGIILAKNGYNVTILEQGGQVGGCLQSFSREGIDFETGMHYLGSADNGQTLNYIFKYLNIYNNINLSKLDTTGYDTISFCNERYKLANGLEPFVETLAEQFPKSKDELYKYHKLITEVASANKMHTLSNYADLQTHLEYRTRSVGEIVDNLISDKRLREVLCGINPLYAGEKDKTPFAIHSLIFDFYNKSAFRIVGGSGKLVSALKKSLEELGGKILTHKKVTKIECKNSLASAVVTKDGERFEGDLIISDIHPLQTLEMIGKDIVKPIYRKRIESLHNTTAPFCIHLKFKNERVKYMNSNLFYFRDKSVWGGEKYDNGSWPKFLLYMHFCHEENPIWAQSGEILTYMNFNETSPWIDTKVGERGKEYEIFKRERAERAIAALEEEIPGISSQIESYYTSSPLTYRDYTLTPEGSMYGVARDINNIASLNISCKTPISNLLLTGQNTSCHGMLGVLSGSLVTCSCIIDAENLLRDILEH